MTEVKQNLTALHQSQMKTKSLEMEKAHKAQLEDADNEHEAAVATLQQGHKTDMDPRDSQDPHYLVHLDPNTEGI